MRLVDAGNSVVVIEHNLDMIKTADYLIALGPEGGDGGGSVVVTGTPEEVAECEKSYTGQYLKKMLSGAFYTEALEKSDAAAQPEKAKTSKKTVKKGGVKSFLYTAAFSYTQKTPGYAAFGTSRCFDCIHSTVFVLVVLCPPNQPAVSSSAASSAGTSVLSAVLSALSAASSALSAGASALSAVSVFASVSSVLSAAFASS